MREHLELSRGQLSRVLLRRRARTTRHTASTTLAQAAGDDGRRRPCAEPLQLVEGAAESMLIVGVGERQRRLVGRVELAPTLEGAPPIARELGRPRLGCIGGNLLLN